MASKLGKKILNIFCMDFALITLYYGIVSRFHHDYCVYALFAFIIGLIISFLVRKTFEFPMWIFSLIVGAVCCYGMYISESEILAKEERNNVALSSQNIETTTEESGRVKSLSDIGGETIKKLNEYAIDDIYANIGCLMHDYSVCKAGKMLEVATSGPSHDHYYNTNGGYKMVNSRKASLQSIVLCTPKDTNSGKGYLKLNYKVTIDFTWGNAYIEEFHNFNGPIYISIVWVVDMNNPELPIKDYGNYLFDASNCDKDYDNWYNKNIVAEKGRYNIEEKLMK